MLCRVINLTAIQWSDSGRTVPGAACNTGAVTSRKSILVLWDFHLFGLLFQPLRFGSPIVCLQSDSPNVLAADLHNLEAERGMHVEFRTQAFRDRRPFLLVDVNAIHVYRIVLGLNLLSVRLRGLLHVNALTSALTRLAQTRFR
jgi:hypothetical protein